MLPDTYDYILIDTPPSLGVLTINSLTSAQEVFIPVGVGTFGLMGIALLETTIAQIKENLELSELEVTGAVATMHEHTRVARDTLSALREHFGDRLFTAVIPKNKDIERLIVEPRASSPTLLTARVALPIESWCRR